MKKFDERNESKKKINNSKKRFFINEKEVRYVRLWVNVWFEEDWKWKDFKRPIIVVKKVWNLFCVLPMTTKGKESSFYFTLSKDYFWKKSSIILSQIKVIDKSRFIEKLWKVKEVDFFLIKQKLKELLL